MPNKFTCPFDQSATVACPKLERDFEIATEVASLPVVIEGDHKSDDSSERIVILMHEAIVSLRQKPVQECCQNQNC